jgi:hypothetical protein
MLGHTPIARPIRAVLDTSIVIKNADDRYQETPFGLTWASAALLDHGFHVPRYGDIASRCRLRSAGIGRNSCANQRPQFVLQSSVF